MARLISYLACAYLLLSPIHCAPVSTEHSLNASVIVRNLFERSAAPKLVMELPDTTSHPNQLDQVETAFNDAAMLAWYAATKIDNDTTVFPHYFSERDRPKVKQIYAAILGQTDPDEISLSAENFGNALLGNINVQNADIHHRCDNTDPKILGYIGNRGAEDPFIVLCPEAFKQKALTNLNGVPQHDDARWYISCDDFDQNGHLTSAILSLGAIMLHEYT